MNRLLTTVLLSASTALAGAGAAVAAPPASTLGPVALGWWSATNRNPGLPAAAPPDVGADDLYVAGANALPGPLGEAGAGPAAIAALRFQLPAGSAAKHVQLRLAGVHPPAVTMTACRALRPFETSYGGGWDEAPTYDCAEAGTARLTADGDVLIDGADRLRAGRELAVVLVPGPLDRVVVTAPDARTLTVTGGNGSAVAAPPPLPPAAPVAPSGTAPLAGGAVPGLAPAGSLPTAAQPPVQPPAAAPAVAPPGRATTAAAAATLADRPWLALLATLLLALLAFVPLVRPRGGAVPGGSVGLRGVGRFRSERAGTVPDLA